MEQIEQLEQIARIAHMEKILDEAAAAICTLQEALERYAALREPLQELAAYYEGPLWRQDFEDDCEGRLPADLALGVLSEDAIYCLLSDIRALHDQYGIKHE